MRKLLVTCMCGERIQVPRSALGRTGLCPSCDRALKISTDNASPMQSANASANGDENIRIPTQEVTDDDAKLTFGKAVDHYYAGELAQALVLLSRLTEVYPHREEIMRARALCTNAIRQATPLPPQPTTHLLESENEEDSMPTDSRELNSDSVRKFILHKMLHGETELAQIQAAELAGRMVGLFRDEQSDELQQASQI